MSSAILKTSRRGPWLSKTDELTQVFGESSQETVPTFPNLSQSGPLASSWRDKDLVVGSISFLSRHELLLLLFLRSRKEGEQGFSPDRNENRYMP